MVRSVIILCFFLLSCESKFARDSKIRTQENKDKVWMMKERMRLDSMRKWIEFYETKNPEIK